MQLDVVKNKINLLPIVIAFIFLISLFWHLKINLFFTDRYDWHIYSGEKYLGINNMQKAIEHAKKAINIDNSRLEAYKLKARAYYALELFNKSEEELLFLKDGNDSLFYNNAMGYVKLQQDLPKDSIFYFKK